MYPFHQNECAVVQITIFKASFVVVVHSSSNNKLGMKWASGKISLKWTLKKKSINTSMSKKGITNKQKTEFRKATQSTNPGVMHRSYSCLT